MKLVLSGKKGCEAFILCPGIVLPWAVSCKTCQEETVRFLAMQKLCDFGNWELFLEVQP